jgi:hypothetical protein
MKNLSLIVVVLLVVQMLSFGQNTTAKARNPNAAQKAPPVATPQNPQLPDYVNTFNNIGNAINPCSSATLRNYINVRRSNIGNINGFPEQLSNYVVARSFVEMDNHLLDCASGLIDSLVRIQPQTVTVVLHDTVYKDRLVPIPKGGDITINQDCTKNMIYLATASGSIILVLLFLLYKFVRAHKIFKDLYEKVYDKIIDELAEKLIVGMGIKEDDKYKDKIKKLVELNQSRKKGEMKLEEYFHKVDVVLD